MAPSQKDGAEKYKNLPLEELQNECRTRGIDFDVNAAKADLISILRKDDNKGPDWSEIYTELMCQAHVSYFEIHKMTIPAIEAIRRKLGKNIALKIGMPGLFGGALDTPTPSPSTGKPPKLSELMNFANAFNGI